MVVITTVRPINVEVGVLDQTHGSALFTRGETQAIVAATLGTLKDSVRLTRCRVLTPTDSCCTQLPSLLGR